MPDSLPPAHGPVRRKVTATAAAEQAVTMAAAASQVPARSTEAPAGIGPDHLTKRGGLVDTPETTEGGMRGTKPCMA